MQRELVTFIVLIGNKLVMTRPRDTAILDRCGWELVFLQSLFLASVAGRVLTLSFFNGVRCVFSSPGACGSGWAELCS